MVDALTEIQINKPLSKVADYSANPDNAPEWYKNIKSATWHSDKPLRIGSKIAFVANFLGKRLEYVYEITTYIPNEILVMQTTQGAFPMKTTYTWNAVAAGVTRMALRNSGMPSGFSKIFSPLMAFMMRKTNQKDLRKLKLILESS